MLDQESQISIYISTMNTPKVTDIFTEKKEFILAKFDTNIHNWVYPHVVVSGNSWIDVVVNITECYPKDIFNILSYEMSTQQYEHMEKTCSCLIEKDTDLADALDDPPDMLYSWFTSFIRSNSEYVQLILNNLTESNTSSEYGALVIIPYNIFTRNLYLMYK